MAVHTPPGLRRQPRHHADVGGMSPGSMPLAHELFQEGLIIPPVLLQRRGEIDESVLDLITRNSRTPDERLGDLSAQIAAQRVGIRRLQELAVRYDPGVLGPTWRTCRTTPRRWYAA